MREENEQHGSLPTLAQIVEADKGNQKILEQINKNLERIAIALEAGAISKPIQDMPNRATTPSKGNGTLICTGGKVVDVKRLEKVLIINIEPDNFEMEKLKCVVFHNKNSFNYEVGDQVNFEGEIQDNTFRGKTEKQFVVKNDLTSTENKRSSDDSDEMEDGDQLPF